jgi:hypothetical protein
MSSPTFSPRLFRSLAPSSASLALAAFLAAERAADLTAWAETVDSAWAEVEAYDARVAAGVAARVAADAHLSDAQRAARDAAERAAFAVKQRAAHAEGIKWEQRLAAL